jgi:hypothetical protein
MRKTILAVVLLLLLSSTETSSAAIRVVQEPGSNPTLVQNVKQVAEAFDSILIHEMNVTIEQDVTIFVTPNRESYALVLQRELGQSKEGAERSARVTSGFSTTRKQAIALNGDAPQMKYLGGVSSVVAHELFHQVQGQLEGLDRYRLYWMSEGTADYVGAMVSDRLGVLNLDGWKKQRTGIIRKNFNRALPQEIADINLAQWTTLMEQKKSPYEMADLMVFFLLEQKNNKGPAAIAEYFRQCNKLRDGKKALAAAFGIDYASFADRFSSWLSSLLAQGGSVEVEAYGAVPAGWTSGAQEVTAKLSAILSDRWNIPLQSTLRIVLTSSSDNFAKALTHELGIAPAETEKTKAETWRFTRGVAIIQAGAYPSAQARAQVVSEVVARMWFADALPTVFTDRLYWLRPGGFFSSAATATDALFPGQLSRQQAIWLRRLDGEIPSLKDLADAPNFHATAKRLGILKVEALSSLATQFLLEKHGLDSYGRWITTIREKGDPRASFASVYGQKREEFAEEFQAWLALRLKKAS